MPRVPSLVIPVLAFALTGANYAADPVGTGSAGMSLPAVLFRLIVEASNVALLFLVLHQVLRQMRQVRATLARSIVVNIFQPGPIHAFSRLTSRAGILLVAVIAPTLLTNPVPADITPEQFLVNWAPYLVVPAVVAILGFVVPLSGLHQRLVVEKERLQNEAESRLEAVLGELNRHVDAGNYPAADTLEKTLGSVVVQRDVLARLPTWPWSTGTLRALIGTVMLPIALFVAQLLIQRVFAQVP